MTLSFESRVDDSVLGCTIVASEQTAGAFFRESTVADEDIAVARLFDAVAFEALKMATASLMVVPLGDKVLTGLLVW